MAGLSVDEFEEKVISFCSESPVVRSVVNYSFGADWYSLRAYLVDDSFVDVSITRKQAKQLLPRLEMGVASLVQTVRKAGTGIPVKTRRSMLNPKRKSRSRNFFARSRRT